MSVTKEDVVQFIESMTVLELSALVKELEEKFGVSAATPVAVAVAGAAPATAPVEEKTEFDAILTGFGENKIGVIKAVRELVPTLGLQEAKALVEAAPKEVVTGANKSTAEEAKKKLEAAGAKVTLK